MFLGNITFCILSSWIAIEIQFFLLAFLHFFYLILLYVTNLFMFKSIYLCNRCRRPLIFQTKNSAGLNSQTLKYQRSTPSGSKNLGIRKSEFDLLLFYFNIFSVINLSSDPSTKVVKSNLDGKEPDLRNWVITTKSDFYFHIYANKCQRSLIFEKIYSDRSNNFEFDIPVIYTIRLQRYRN